MEANLLNKLTVSTLAALSKAYISQVKHGKRPPSEKLLRSLHSYLDEKQKKQTKETKGAIDLFLKSRRQGVTPSTILFYKKYLIKAILVLGLSPTPRQLSSFLSSLECSQGGKHAHYRAISVFYNWLYSPRSGFGLRNEQNPASMADPPKRPILILPSLNIEQVKQLIATAHCIRDKIIVSLFAESGLRLSELLNITPRDIDWETRTIRVLGKGSKEGLAPFGSCTEQLLKRWLQEYNPLTNQRISNFRFWGIKAMLDELKKETCLPCNPHTFRRTFACLLRKTGVDIMTIKDPGRWESSEMVQRYTRSVTFQDSLNFYKAPLST